MARFLFYLLAATAAVFSTVSSASLKRRHPMMVVPFSVPSNAEVLDLRTTEHKRADKLAKRQPGGVYICKAIYFDAKQGCKSVVVSNGQAYSLVGTDYNNAISSAGPDVEVKQCRFYDGFDSNAKDCSGWYLDLYYPGYDDFRNFTWGGGGGITWNDITSCIKCWW